MKFGEMPELMPGNGNIICVIFNPQDNIKEVLKKVYTILP